MNAVLGVALEPKITERGSAGRSGKAEDMPVATRRLLQQCDRGALAEFYDLWFERIYGFVRRMVVEEHLAEDLTQDIFIHLQQNFASYDPERPLQPWVFTITANKVRDFWRSRRHNIARREITIDDEARSGIAVSNAPGPSRGMEDSELGRQIRGAIDDLPDSMRVTLELRYFQGMSFAAISAIVDRNETAVRKRYSRALEELRITLGRVLDFESGAGA